MKKIISAILLGSIFTPAFSEDISGQLEVAKNHSVIYTISPESGDAVAYYLSNKTKIGKAVLGNCLNGMYCAIQNAVAKDNPKLYDIKYSISPSAVLEITSGKNAYIASAIDSYEKSVEMRYGVLKINDDNEILIGKNKLKSSIEANNGLSIVFSTELGSKDIALVMNSGGSSCPALFHIVNFDKRNYAVSKEFGTCSDLVNFTIMDEKNLKIEMVGFAGPHEPEKEKLKSMKVVTTFIYNVNGRLKENGVQIN